MAVIGNLSSLITFSVSSKKVLTFNKMTQTVKSRWATHSIIGSKPKSEYIGADLKSISLNINLDAMHGVRPRSTLEAIENAVERGSILTFVLGGKKVGRHSWVITQCSEAWDCIYSKGELVQASVTLSLQEYV